MAYHKLLNYESWGVSAIEITEDKSTVMMKFDGTTWPGETSFEKSECPQWKSELKQLLHEVLQYPKGAMINAGHSVELGRVRLFAARRTKAPRCEFIEIRADTAGGVPLDVMLHEQAVQELHDSLP